MTRMSGRGLQVVGILAAGAVFGWVAVPPMVAWAANMVAIQGANGPTVNADASHHLLTNDSGSNVSVKGNTYSSSHQLLVRDGAEVMTDCADFFGGPSKGTCPAVQVTNNGAPLNVNSVATVHLIATGTGNFAASSCPGGVEGISLSSVVADSSSGGSMEITGSAAFAGSPAETLWKGSIASAGHLNDSFNGGFGFYLPSSGNVVTVTGTVTWFLYGITAGPDSAC